MKGIDVIMANTKLIAKNPNAYHNYEIIDKIECRDCFDSEPK